MAGVQNLVGQALLEELNHQGYWNIIGGPKEEPDLTHALEVDAFFAWAAPEYVFLTAGKSGGILENQKYPAELMLNNLLVECHVIHSAFCHGVKKLLYLASSCIYPKHCPQPMQEDSLLTGLLETTNESYAVAKIAGIKLCQAYQTQYGANFICGIPANDFGPGDDFNPESGHVIPALIHRMHEAKLQGAEGVEIWGSGSPRREFIYAPDLAEACVLVMQKYNGTTPINLGSGSDFTIAELAKLIKEVTGFKGKIHFDPRKADGMPRKLLDGSKLKSLKWAPRTDLRTALEATYQWYLQNCDPRLEGSLKNRTGEARKD